MERGKGGDDGVAQNMEQLAKREDVTVAGHRLALWRSGSGTPVLLLHGITTYSFIWRNLMAGLSRHYEVLAVDLLGCGDSAMPLETSYSLAAHAQRLLTLIAQLRLPPIHLVGHDLGGGIAQIMAVRQPERVLDCTLINTVGHDFWPVQPIIAMRTPIIRQFAMATLDMGALQLIVRRGLYHKERCTPELMALFHRPLTSPLGRKAFLHFAACLDNGELTAIEGDLQGLSLPVLLLRGDADPYLAANIVEKLHCDIPGSRLARIATGGHFIQEDEPQWLLDQLHHFFAESADG